MKQYHSCNSHIIPYTTLQPLSILNIGTYCRPLSILGSSSRILGHMYSCLVAIRKKCLLLRWYTTGLCVDTLLWWVSSTYEFYTHKKILLFILYIIHISYFINNINVLSSFLGSIIHFIIVPGPTSHNKQLTRRVNMAAIIMYCYDDSFDSWHEYRFQQRFILSYLWVW